MASENVQAARALGRCYGALFLSCFGGAWLLLAAYAFGRLSTVGVCLIAAATMVFVTLALRFRTRAKGAGAETPDPVGEEERRRSDRTFGIVNAVTWIAVFLIFQILPRLGHENLAIPAVVTIVGLHFFPMPPLYRHTANLIAGAGMAAWAVLCILLFDGDRRIGFAALGAGLLLWAAAAWALKTANQLLESTGL